MNKTTSCPTRKSAIWGRISGFWRRQPPMALLLPMAAMCLLSSGAMSADQNAGQGDLGASATKPAAENPPTLEETRLTMGKWIETQQIISKERKDWQQGKEILVSRLDLVK